MEILARVGRKFELYQIRSNSSQVGGQTIPNSIKVVNLARVGQTVENLAGVAKHLSLIKFKPTQSNLSQLKPSCELGSSWPNGGKFGSSWAKI